MTHYRDFTGIVCWNINMEFCSESHCDVTLISKREKHKVKAHKMVLAASSQFFYDMFDGSPRKASAKEVKVKEFNGKYLKPIINYIYTDWIKLTNRAVKGIIRAARVLQFDSLVDFCIDFMVQQLDSWNCIGVALFAKENQFQELEKAAVKFICKNLETLHYNNKFLKLNVDQFINFIANDKLCVPSKVDVFHSIMAWMEHDKESRKESIGKLLTYIWFPLLPQYFVENEKSNESNLLNKTREWHLPPELHSYLHMFPKLHESLRDFEPIIAISVWGNSERIQYVEVYYFGDNKWMCKKCAVPMARRTFACCTMNSKLIIAGGILPSQEITETVDCFDLRTLKWSGMPSMNAKRVHFGMVALNGEVYAIGGYGSRYENLRSVEKWKPSKAQWQPVTEMSRNLPSIFKVSAGCNVICVSAPKQEFYYDGDLRFHHSIYYPQTNTWAENWLTTRGRLLGTGLWRCSSITYLIVVSRNAITRYNLEDKSSMDISSDTIARGYRECGLVGDRLIFYGLYNFQEYNLLKNQWKTSPQVILRQKELRVLLKSHK